MINIKPYKHKEYNCKHERHTFACERFSPSVCLSLASAVCTVR